MYQSGNQEHSNPVLTAITNAIRPSGITLFHNWDVRDSELATKANILPQPSVT